MPVCRRPISVSQLADLLGLEPWQVIAVERQGSSLVLVLEPDPPAPASTPETQS